MNNEIDKLTFSFSQMSLSPSQKKFTLVLDLDETLVHSICSTNINKINFLKTKSNLLVHYMENDIHIFVFYRPHVLYFLQEMSKYFYICVFTNGSKNYADVVVTMLNSFAQHSYITRWYSRTGEYPFYKYISLIDYVDTKNVLIIDDNKEIWKNDGLNVIKIKQFVVPIESNFVSDEELLNLGSIISNVMKNDNNTSDVHNIIDNIKNKYETY